MGVYPDGIGKQTELSQGDWGPAWVTLSHLFPRFRCFRFFLSFGRVSPTERGDPALAPPSDPPISRAGDSWRPELGRSLAAGTRWQERRSPGRRRVERGRSRGHSGATQIAAAELGPATRDPLKGTRAGGHNRGSALKTSRAATAAAPNPAPALHTRRFSKAHARDSHGRDGP